MQFIISNYGDSYCPLLTVCLDSLRRTHPTDKVTVLWDDMSEVEVKLLKHNFPHVEFIHQEKGINSTDVYQRIPLKLRFWSDIAKETSEEVLVFLDSDTVVYKNISEYTQGDFDFLFTHKDEQFPLNVGVVIVKNSERIAKFLELWRSETEKIVADADALEQAKQQNGAADQQALVDLMSNSNYAETVVRSYDFGEIKFKGVPCSELNQTNSVPVDGGSYIYHFKGGWRPILLEEAGYGPHRTEENSAEMHAFWEQRYADINEQLLTDFVVTSASKHQGILDWDTIVYEERGILHSEMLAVISTMKELGVEVVIESGRARGQSTEMLALAFENTSVPVVSIEWMRDEAAEFAEPRLSKYKHVELLYGDAHQVLPETLARYPDKKVGVLFDGPKGEEAFALFAKVYAEHHNIVVGFFHDCRKSYRRMINPAREQTFKYFDRLFFTDSDSYITKFAEVDKMCEAKPGNINIHSWRPYTKGFWQIGSYGPTIGMVLPSVRDRIRARKLLPVATITEQPKSSWKQLIPQPVKRLVRKINGG